MAKSKYIETLEEQYTKKDAKSVLRYKAPDNKWRYIQTDKDASGGNMPSGGGITEVTWQELKDKRDNGELNPGSLYRITDYNCTTTQENTQSAGHQFDIVLLALSENKLAEEGWAMMHGNIYDVTFADGVIKRCYIYEDTIAGYYYVVDINTLLGVDMDNNPDVGELVINEEAKTAVTDSYNSTDLTGENLTYNYFQNSNLSAWKVWYCLDNDKSRFAWADDSVDEDVPENFIANGVKYYRYSLQDVALDKKAPYCYKGLAEGSYIYVPTIVTSETEEISINTYYNPPVLNSPTQITSYTPAHEGTGLPNGRGVIYRLIDEWNNDVPYDFKNIQSMLPLTDGLYDESGVGTYVYTFDMIDTSENHVDLSMYVNEYNNQALVKNVKWYKNTKLFNDDSVPLLAVNNFYNGYNQYSFKDIDLNVSFYNKILNSGSGIKAQELIECVIDGTNNCTFGYNCISLKITNGDGLNYGNNGVELATKS